MKILVTGGAGFLGSHLADKLISLNHRVVVVDNLSTGKKKFVNKKAKFYRADITKTKLKEIFSRERPEIVFHLAAQKSVPHSLKHPLDDASNNIWGSLKVIEASLKVKVKKLVFASTGGAIYGEAKEIPSSEKTLEKPDSPYGLSKLTVDNYLTNFYSQVKKLKSVSLRFSNIYGPRQDPDGEAGVVAIFVNGLLKGKQCYINGSGSQTRDFLYVEDAVNSLVKSLRNGHGIYNIGTGRETSINVLYHLIAGLISEKKAKHRESIPGEVRRSALKINKAGKELGWQPKNNLLKGLKKTIDYFKEN
ncbi:MAG TPA: NAD-dependent epimerase/dehydratase family protein [Patescibacteria group bacterium]|nr:NAD-dependent epimerase/dehydratase family protein [Patescibacteria group bacterium]